MRYVDDGYFVVWQTNLCTSANASFRVGPFPSWEDAKVFIEHIPDGEIDDEPAQVVTHLCDYSPEELIDEWRRATAEGSD